MMALEKSAAAALVLSAAQAELRRQEHERGVAINFEGDSAQIDGSFDLRALASAMLNALGEPTPAMLARGAAADAEGSEYNARDVWQAMLSEILAVEVRGRSQVPARSG